MYNTGYNKCKELLPTKLQFKVDKNPTWHGSWMLLNALFYYREGYASSPLKNVMLTSSLKCSTVACFFLSIDFINFHTIYKILHIKSCSSNQNIILHSTFHIIIGGVDHNGAQVLIDDVTTSFLSKNIYDQLNILSLLLSIWN